MTPKRFLLAACTALAIAPSSALAQSDAPGDSYLRPILLNEGSLSDPQPIPNGSVPGFQINTSGYGEQADLFSPPGSGGPPEPLQCGNSPYGKTAWAVFYAHRYGRADIKASGAFDEVIAIVPFRGPTSDPTPIIDAGLCVDRLSGISENFGDDPPSVAPGWYAIQMGGAGGAGGVLEGSLEFLPPERLTGDAVLSWNGGSGGAKVAVKATARKGSRISFKCVKKSCGRLPKTQTVRKTVGDTLAKPLGDVTPREAPSREFRRVSDNDPAIVAARSYIRNKFLKNGTRFEVRITAPGFIGNYYSWNVSGGKVGTKTRRCMNPGSTRPARRCGG